MQSLIFDFKESPSFREKVNKEFDLEAMGENCFYIVLVDDICDDNINDCLNEDNQLKYSESHLLPTECYLQYRKQGTNSYIELSSDVSVDFSSVTDFNMKGAFLTTDSGYVIGYSINTYSLNVSESMIFEEGLQFIIFSEGVYDG